MAGFRQLMWRSFLCAEIKIRATLPKQIYDRSHHRINRRPHSRADWARPSDGHRAAGGAPSQGRMDSRRALGTRPFVGCRGRWVAGAVVARKVAGGFAIVVGRPHRRRGAFRHRSLGVAPRVQTQCSRA